MPQWVELSSATPVSRAWVGCAKMQRRGKCYLTSCWTIFLRLLLVVRLCLSCEVTCPPLQVPANGLLLDSDGTVLNSTADGGGLPVDEIPYSGSSSGAETSGSQWYAGNVVYYRCYSGYELPLGNVSFCTSSGSWVPQNITCLKSPWLSHTGILTVMLAALGGVCLVLVVMIIFLCATICHYWRKYRRMASLPDPYDVLKYRRSSSRNKLIISQLQQDTRDDTNPLYLTPEEMHDFIAHL